MIRRKEGGHFLCKFCTEISEAKVGAMAWRWRSVGPRSKPHFSVCLAAAACCPAFCAQGQIHAQRLQVFSYVFDKGRRIVKFIKRIHILGNILSSKKATIPSPPSLGENCYQLPASIFPSGGKGRLLTTSAGHRVCPLSRGKASFRDAG